jgi:hypothetical protein
MRVYYTGNPSSTPAQATAAVPVSSAPAQATATSPISSPSLGIQQPTTHDDDMRDLRAAAAASLAESLEASHKHEQI